MSTRHIETVRFSTLWVSLPSHNIYQIYIYIYIYIRVYNYILICKWHLRLCSLHRLYMVVHTNFRIASFTEPKVHSGKTPCHWCGWSFATPARLHSHNHDRGATWDSPGRRLPFCKREMNGWGRKWSHMVTEGKKVNNSELWWLGNTWNAHNVDSNAQDVMLT